MPPKIPSSAQDGPAIPPEARSQGGLNDTTPPEQRKPDLDVSLSDGPKIGPNGEYQPARYPTSRGNIRTDR